MAEEGGAKLDAATPPADGGDADSTVFCQFRESLTPEISIPVAAVNALTGVIKRSTASTMMGLEIELRAAADELRSRGRLCIIGKSAMSLDSACELYLRYVTRTFLDFPDFEACKRLLIERGEAFAVTSMRSRAKIGELLSGFVRDGTVVLTHGYSRVVLGALVKAAERKRFTVYCTEGRPNGSGLRSVAALKEAGIASSLILDVAVGYIMQRADLVLVGAEGVTESGGIVNQIGTYQVAMLASALKKPFYVGAESFKFARTFPLTQADLPETKEEQVDLKLAGGEAVPEGVASENPSVDYTPPDYITLLFTDLGILTPSAVSDELIKLYS